MASNIAKLFIVLSLVFEVLTITTGSAFYPAFIALSAVLFAGLILKSILTGHVSHDHGTLQSMYRSFRFPV